MLLCNICLRRRRYLLIRRAPSQGLKSKPESAKDDMNAAGDNIQSAVGKTGDAATDNASAAKADARSAVRSLLMCCHP